MAAVGLYLEAKTAYDLWQLEYHPLPDDASDDLMAKNGDFVRAYSYAFEALKTALANVKGGV